MKLEYLEYLVDFADTQSISATASRFYISVQGMSRALRQIEKEFGADLFTRTNSSIVLNEHGMQFVTDIRPALEMIRTARGRLTGSKQAPGEAAREIRIIATPIVLKSVLSLFDLQSTNARHYRLLIRETSVASCLKKEGSQLTRTRSLGVISGPPRQREVLRQRRIEAGLEYKPLIKCEICLVTSIHSPLARLESVSAEMLRSHPFGYFADHVALDLMDDFVPESNLLTVTNDWFTLERQLLTGRINTIVPKLFCLANPLRKGLVSVPFDNEEYKPEIGLIGTPANMADPDVRFITEELQAILTSSLDKPGYDECYTTLF